MEKTMVCIKCGQDVEIVRIGGLELIEKHECDKKAWVHQIAKPSEMIAEPHPLPDKVVVRMMKKNEQVTVSSDPLHGIDRISSKEAKKLFGSTCTKAAARKLRKLGFVPDTPYYHGRKYYWVRRGASKHSNAVVESSTGRQPSDAKHAKGMQQGTGRQEPDIMEMFKTYQERARKQGYTISLSAVKAMYEPFKHARDPYYAMSNVLRHAGSLMRNNERHIGVPKVMEMLKRQSIIWKNRQAMMTRAVAESRLAKKIETKPEDAPSELSNTALDYERKIKEYAREFDMPSFRDVMTDKMEGHLSTFGMVEWQALLHTTEVHDAYRAYERALLPKFSEIMGSLGFNVDKVEIDSTTKEVSWRWKR